MGAIHKEHIHDSDAGTGEGRLSPPITSGTPNVFHLPASLHERFFNFELWFFKWEIKTFILDFGEKGHFFPVRWIYLRHLWKTLK